MGNDMKITKLDFTRIKKQSLRTYLYSVVQLVEMQNPTALKVEFFYNKLSDSKKDFDKLKIKYNEASAEVAELKKRVRAIKNVLRSIKLQLDSAQRMSYVTNAAEVSALSKIVEHYLKLALKESKDPTENICTRMLKEINDSAELMSAFETLGLNPHFAELQRLINEAVLLRKTILADMQTKELSVTNDLRKQLTEAITHLFMAIEIESIRNTDTNYEPLIASLNELNSRYRNIMKAKATRAKAKRNKKESTLTLPSQTMQISLNS